MWRERALIVLVVLLHQIYGGDGCSPSSCGKISNISYPFRLQGDPKVCGRFELSCENNITVLSLLSGTFHVEAMNYNNFTIRLVDPGLQPTNCSSLPRYSLSPTNFTDDDLRPYGRWYMSGWSYEDVFYEHIVFLNCSHPVYGKRNYVDTGGCVNWESKGYIYAMAVSDLLGKDLEVGCQVKLVSPISWWGLETNGYSYATIHTALLYGFQVSWIRLVCEGRCTHIDLCHFSMNQRLECYGEATPTGPVYV
ncbi:uncharacterized protein LOC106764746 [Vigna radiata var. radiata]|uniref:Uncharacterized protein LOC106764746 n=1 Tax=Vigna radiata var. radiata TaxID=3916 RepID=A0A1S3UEY2_VIGRR|nr:uncharacterized protein LOC106764746 [Vigna radiata var. radiata]